MNIYNYAVSGLKSWEYRGYINFAKKIKNKGFKYIIVGADFFAANKIKNKLYNPPSAYVRNCTSYLYKYKTLLSLISLKHSIVSIKNYYFTPMHFYNKRTNIKFQQKIPKKQRMQNYNAIFKEHMMEMKKSNFIYDENYLDVLKQLKRDNPGTQFIVFTSPITANLLTSILINAKRLQEHKRWLKELIEVFGQVHHFMTINPVTTNLQNYLDTDHFYPYVGTWIAQKILNPKTTKVPKGFGFVLTKDNIQSYFKTLNKQLKNYPIPKVG